MAEMAIRLDRPMAGIHNILQKLRTKLGLDDRGEGYEGFCRLGNANTQIEWEGEVMCALRWVCLVLTSLSTSYDVLTVCVTGIVTILPQLHLPHA